MLWFKKRFCEIHPICYKISVQKEVIKRHISDFFSKEKIAKVKSNEKLPAVISSFQTTMIKRAPGVDPTSQVNKAVNIRIASSNITGMLIHPGESFSFWHSVGKITRKKGYKDGRIISGEGLIMGLGGGLCNLGNSLNRIVQQSPLTVTEFHTHSDALAPDEGERIPLASGTSVSYNYVDFRFKNNTDQTYQLILWCEGDEFFCELRAEKQIEFSYHLVEEDRHFRKEGDDYYHLSKLYRVTSDKNGTQVAKDLIWDNRSEVMFDHNLIPKELIRE